MGDTIRFKIRVIVKGKKAPSKNAFQRQGGPNNNFLENLLKVVRGGPHRGILPLYMGGPVFYGGTKGGKKQRPFFKNGGEKKPAEN